MPDFAPFRGVRFDPERVTPEAAICPPYDIVDERLHAVLLRHHPLNAIRWVLGEEPASPRGGADEYRRRGAAIRELLARGILTRDREDSYYVYSCNFTDLDGAAICYRGLLGAVRAAPWGEAGVLPHEQVKEHVVSDRLSLLRESRVDTGTVQLVFDDRPGDVARTLENVPRRQLFAGEDWEGSWHCLEVVDDARAVAGLRDLLIARPAVVADGHHRYTTAAILARESRLRGSDRILAALGDLFQDGVRLHPTHRLYRWPPTGDGAQELAASLRARLDDGDGEEWSIEPREGPEVRLRSRSGAGTPILARRLQDVIDGLDSAPRMESFASGDTARRRLREGEGDALLCLLPPIAKDEFWVRATAGEIFPPKTTYFQPKVASGILARLLEGENDDED